MVLSFLFTGGFLNAQLCAGSLGDPVVNITFGQGSNPGPQLSPGITNYNYVSSGCPDDGNYGIGTSTIACFGNTWHTVPEDHTPQDGNGYMMIINASNSPGVFYVDTVTALCGETTYEFAAWILNVIKVTSCNSNANRPNVTFLIETLSGQNLMTYKSGDINAAAFPAWRQYGSFFTTPGAVTSVVITMINNAPGGCGNDLLLDDITFRPCGSKVTGTLAGGGETRELCIGETATITMEGKASLADANTFYQWQKTDKLNDTWSDIPGANSTTYTTTINANSANTYQFRMAVGQGNNNTIVTCRVVSNFITINVNENPLPAAGNNGPKCVGETLILNASGGNQYKWTGPNAYTSTLQNPSILNIRNIDAGRYYVEVTTQAGCKAIDSTLVSVRPPVTATASPDAIICQGNSVQLNAAGGNDYVWSPVRGLSNANTSSPVARPDTTTEYTVAVSNGACTAYDTVLVQVNNKPVASAGADVQMLQGNSVRLNGTAGGGNINFSWTPNIFMTGANSLNPLVSPPRDTTYTLTVVSQNGCGSATDNVFVRVFKAVKAPNAFSPNGDGLNDVWKIEALDTYPEATINIFNRYGQLMFAAISNAQPWDGTYKSKPLPVGAYYYIIDLKNGFAKLTGSVVILR